MILQQRKPIPHRVRDNLVLWAVVAGLLVCSPSSIHAQNSTNSETDLVDCPLCADPTHFPLDSLSRFVSGADTYTCQSAFELGNLSLPVENCTFWQSRGEVICQCGEEPPLANECTLCEDGSALPEPIRTVVPGEICAEIQIDARRDDPDVCIVYQQTMGVYCGCDNPQATSLGQEVCRLCGGANELPDPLTLVYVVNDNGDNIEISCVELEFAANLPGVDCAEFQLLYLGACCPDGPAGDDKPGDAAPRLGLSLLLTLIPSLLAVG